MRVQRAWLGRAEEATNKRFGDEGELSMREENLGDGHGGRYGDGREVDGNPENEQEEQERILWIGEKKIAGLKVRVREKRFSRRQQPLLMATDEEPAVSTTTTTITTTTQATGCFSPLFFPFHSSLKLGIVTDCHSFARVCVCGCG